MFGQVWHFLHFCLHPATSIKCSASHIKSHFSSINYHTIAMSYQASVSLCWIYCLSSVQLHTCHFSHLLHIFLHPFIISYQASHFLLAFHTLTKLMFLERIGTKFSKFTSCLLPGLTWRILDRKTPPGLYKNLSDPWTGLPSCFVWDLSLHWARADTKLCTSPKLMQSSGPLLWSDVPGMLLSRFSAFIFMSRGLQLQTYHSQWELKFLED